MPLIASAIKRARQNEVRRKRLLPYRTHMKTVMRTVMDLVKQGKKDEARALLPMAYKAIDTAAKRYIIHWKTASRRKSRIAGLVG
ncbi:30S ribosomal protein S20 [Candidatus Peribacteria bacterium RIFCSPHIGHO2_01_FULL_51_9]|nr:MAG: 30S ribosomal protein S20 [Candidatus Peribacteria bacterium RIFCSPHIGHO2_01_FULL_51_9]